MAQIHSTLWIRKIPKRKKTQLILAIMLEFRRYLIKESTHTFSLPKLTNNVSCVNSIYLNNKTNFTLSIITATKRTLGGLTKQGQNCHHVYGINSIIRSPYSNVHNRSGSITMILC